MTERRTLAVPRSFPCPRCGSAIDSSGNRNTGGTEAVSSDSYPDSYPNSSYQVGPCLEVYIAMDICSCRSDTGPPPPKRGRIESAGDENNKNEGALHQQHLPPDVWGAALSFLPFDGGIKQCTSINHYFLKKVAPHVKIHSSSLLGDGADNEKKVQEFELKITLTEHLQLLYDVGSRTPRAEPSKVTGRFHHVDKVAIKSSKDVPMVCSTLLGVLKDLVPNATRITIDGDLCGANDSVVGRDLVKTFGGANDQTKELTLRTYENEKNSSLFTLEQIIDALLVQPLQSLTKLELWISEAMIPSESHSGQCGASLGRLKQLSNLKNLTLIESGDDQSLCCDEDFVNGAISGCAQIKNLRILKSSFIYNWNDKSKKNFAKMMLSLENLEELSVVKYPSPDFWQTLCRRSVEADRKFPLKKLSCYDFETNKEDLESLIDTVVTLFPLCSDLEIMSVGHSYEGEDALAILSRLKVHPSLNKVVIYFESGDLTDIPVVAEELQPILGSRITVVDGCDAYGPLQSHL